MGLASNKVEERYNEKAVTLSDKNLIREWERQKIQSDRKWLRKDWYTPYRKMLFCSLELNRRNYHTKVVEVWEKYS